MDILLVDDNEYYLLVIKDLLYSNGYSVITATNGMEACEILDNSDIDMIISDIKMPHLDGIKLHAYVREIEKYKDLKFIFMTGYKEVYADLLALEPGKDFLFDKSVTANEIVATVNNLLFGKFIGKKVA